MGGSPHADRHHGTARLVVSCPDRPGIVAAVSGFLFDHGANIVSSDQHSTDPEGGVFFMRMEFSTLGLDIAGPELADAFGIEVAAIQLVDGVGPATTFLDISGDVGSSGLEQGLLSMALAPDYESSRLFYVYFTDPNGDIRIEELRRSESDPEVADPDSRRLVLTVDIATSRTTTAGSSSSAPTASSTPASATAAAVGTRSATGQNLDTLLGSLIRIDPREPSTATTKAKEPKAKEPRR